MPFRFLAAIPLLCGAALATAIYPGATPPPSALEPGFESIKISEAKELLSYLAGPECEGRGTGQPGFQKAADFVADHFKRWGLKPMGDHGTYFQNLKFYRYHAKPGTVFLEADGTIEKLADEPGKFQLGGLYANVDVTAPVSLLRVKSGSSSLPDDSAIRGRILIVVGPDPTGDVRRVLMRSQPAGLLFVTDKVRQNEWAVSQSKIAETHQTPIGFLDKEAALWVLGSLQADKTLLDATELPAAGYDLQPLPAKLRFAAETEFETVKVPNVVGLVEGTDPTLKSQVVGIGAHLDHLGIENGTVYPGADDDGSGTTALLTIAHAVSLNPRKPRRSILFMEFCGEEMGLLGSSYYAEHPVVPHKQMVAELQMDMVGRDSDGVQNGDTSRVDVAAKNVDTIRLVGSKRISRELDQLVQETNKSIGFRFKYDAEDVYTRSDHYNFAKNGIPIAFLFDGFHPDYHRPTDTVDKIDWNKITSAAKLYYLTAESLADRDRVLKKDVAQAEKQAGRGELRIHKSFK